MKLELIHFIGVRWSAKIFSFKIENRLWQKEPTYSGTQNFCFCPFDIKGIIFEVKFEKVRGKRSTSLSSNEKLFIFHSCQRKLLPCLENNKRALKAIPSWHILDQFYGYYQLLIAVSAMTPATLWIMHDICKYINLICGLFDHGQWWYRTFLL